MIINNFTPTEKAIMNVLADGQPHTPEELHSCLPDDLGPRSNIHPHITNIRKRLNLIGEDIGTAYVKGKLHYRHVRLLDSATSKDS